MQSAMVLLMALSGLGCQNRADDVAGAPMAPSAVVAPAVDALPGYTTPPPYPRYHPETDLYAEAGYATRGDAMRATFCSFFCAWWSVVFAGVFAKNGR